MERLSQAADPKSLAERLRDTGIPAGAVESNAQTKMSVSLLRNEAAASGLSEIEVERLVAKPLFEKTRMNR